MSVLIEEERVNIDEMKKRAITKARSYDEFRQMVLCANLKPMKSKESRILKLAYGQACVQRQHGRAPQRRAVDDWTVKESRPNRG